MTEYIDIISYHGIPTGKSALKSIIHSKGFYHNTAHIWFYNDQGNILLAQRAASKLIFPLLWDVSVAGHINAGETIEDGAIREIKEEIGLSMSKKNLYKIGVNTSFNSYDNGIIDNEFHHTFIAKLNTNLDTLKLDNHEVEAIKLIHINKFQKLINTIDNHNHFVSSNKVYYQSVLDQIKSALKVAN